MRHWRARWEGYDWEGKEWREQRDPTAKNMRWRLWKIIMTLSAQALYSRAEKATKRKYWEDELWALLREGERLNIRPSDTLNQIRDAVELEDPKRARLKLAMAQEAADLDWTKFLLSDPGNPGSKPLPHFGEVAPRSGDACGRDLRGAPLAGAVLNYADLGWTKLSGAVLSCASFKNAELSGTHLESCQLNTANFRNAKLVGTDLSGASLEGAKFTGAKMVVTDFTGATLANCSFKDTEVDSTCGWSDKNHKLGDELRIESRDLHSYETPSLAYWLAENAYRRVRQLLKRHGFYDKAGNLYYRERVCKRRAKSTETVQGIIWPCIKASKWVGARVPWIGRALGWALPETVNNYLQKETDFWRPPDYWDGADWDFSWMPELLLFDWSCGYGEKPHRLLFWAISALFGWAMIYRFVVPDQILKDTTPIESFGTALYFSVATFTTLGFGDYAPSGPWWVKILVVSEAVLGALIIGLAMVTFARKAIRD
mgnify:FL=1